MKSHFDPSTQRDFEEFYHRLKGEAKLFRRAVVILAADRMLEDLEVVYAPKKPRRPLSWARHVVGRFSRWLLRKIFPSRFSHVRRARPKPTAVIIAGPATTDRFFSFGLTYSDFYPDHDDPPANDW